MGEPGCFTSYTTPNKNCDGADTLPAEFLPLPWNQSATAAWEEMIFGKNPEQKTNCK